MGLKTIMGPIINDMQERLKCNKKNSHRFIMFRKENSAIRLKKYKYQTSQGPHAMCDYALLNIVICAKNN